MNDFQLSFLPTNEPEPAARVNPRSPFAPDLTFEVLGVPVAKGRPRTRVHFAGARTFAQTYTPKETRNAEDLFAARACEFRPDQPLEGPLSLFIAFMLPIPQAFPHWKEKAAAECKVFPQGRPDLDNYVKLVLDAMNGSFFLDDKQVVDLRAVKMYARVPRTIISITRLQQAEKR